MKNSNKKYSIKLLLALMIFSGFIFSQKPYRVGTSTANFLEIGYGATATSLGDAFTAVSNDVSAIYWNPAGLATLNRSEATFSVQPWYADINTMFSSVAINMDDMGTFAIGVVAVDYGDMEVTSLDMQNGTGETFSASDIAVSFGYARRLATWFSFGAAAKYISSTIWHSSANAFAFDLGVLINSGFFSPTDKVEDGLNIGMSVSNYGTQMRFDGMDLLQPIDPTPDNNGDYKDVEGQYRLAEWELPLLFRLGVSLNIFKNNSNALRISIDALHPNNNSESVNVGASYKLIFVGLGSISFNAGYKGFFLDENPYGLTFGADIESYLLYNKGWKINYSYRTHEYLGNTHNYGVNLFF